MRIGIIAAGGNSRRTGLGDYTTKAALLLAGKPLLVHQIEFLQRSGFERAIVVCQPKHVRLLSSLLSEEQRTTTAFLIAESAGGWGGKIERAMAFVNDDDEVGIISCDNYHTAPKITALNGAAPALFSYTSSEGKTLTDGPVFGRYHDPTLMLNPYWKEQPGRGFNGDLFTGFVVARGRTLRRALSQIIPSARGEKEITSLLSAMWTEGCLMAVPYDGTYEDVSDLHALARIHAQIALGPFVPMVGATKTVIGAGVLLHTNDSVFLTERQDGRGWVPPGGLVDANETFVQAASREIQEEAGLHIPPSDLRLLGVYPTIGKGGEAACSVIFHAYVPGELRSMNVDPSEVKASDWFNREKSSQITIPFDLNLAVDDFFNGKELDCR